MIFPRRGFLQLAAGTVALAAFAPIASAQTYPSRPITLVVPFPAAGPADVLARILAERMRETLGQPVVIENVTGAAGSIATGRVVRATADGHTIMLGNLGTHVVNGAIYPLQYDLAKDFEPISLLPSNHQLLIANKATPEKDLRELIARLKANPDKVTIGNAGPGSPSHLTAVYFQTAVGKNFQLVPYRGTPQVLQDLIAGQIDLVFDQASRARCRRCGAASSRPMGSRPRRGSPRRQRFRRWTKAACRASTRRSGLACGPRRTHPRP